MLFKHCKSEHNIFNGCRTLRLGTLAYYAEADPKFCPWADINEGIRKGTFAGRFIANELTFTDIFTGPGTVTFRNSPYAIKIDNCYLYSASFRKEALYPEYDSFFPLPSPQLMACSIAELLQQQLLLDDLNIEDFKMHPSSLIVHFEYQKITYFSANDFSITPETLSKVKDLYSQHPVYFSKLKEFQKEEEYRFCFSIMHPLNGKILPVKTAPKDLNISNEFMALCNDRSAQKA